MGESQSFRASVGVVVINDRWDVLALERIDKAQLKAGVKKGTGQWQMPQGGLDGGEEPDEAWVRELNEEIAASKEDVEPIGVFPDWLVYELPSAERQDPSIQAKHGRGQAQKWFFVRLKPSASIRLDAGEEEFFTYRWMPLEKLAEETWEVRRPIYRRLAQHLAELRQQKQHA